MPGKSEMDRYGSMAESVQGMKLYPINGTEECLGYEIGENLSQ